MSSQMCCGCEPQLTNQRGRGIPVLRSTVPKKRFISTDMLLRSRKGGMETEREGVRLSPPSREDDNSAGQMKCSTCHNLRGAGSQGHLCKVRTPNTTLCDISRCHSGTPAIHFRAPAWEAQNSHLLVCCFLTKSLKCPHSRFRASVCAARTLTLTSLSHLDGAQASKHPHTPWEWFCSRNFQTVSFALSLFLASVWSLWIYRKCVLVSDLS